MSDSKTSKWAGSGAAILRCTCTDTLADQFHGPGLRAKNKCNGGYRCTTCLKVSPAK